MNMYINRYKLNIDFKECAYMKKLYKDEYTQLCSMSNHE